MGEGDYLQRFKDSPGKEEVSSGGQQQHCSATAGQTRGAQSQVANHSAEGSNVAEGRQVEDTGGSLVDTYSSEGGTGKTPLGKQHQQTPATRSQARGQRGKNLGGGS